MSTDQQTTFQTLITSIRPADLSAMTAARERQAQLTKPAGALGRLCCLNRAGVG